MGATFLALSLTLDLVHGWLDTLYGCAAFCFTFAVVVIVSMSKGIRDNNNHNNMDIAEKGSEADVKEEGLPTYEEVLGDNSSKKWTEGYT